MKKSYINPSLPLIVLLLVIQSCSTPDSVRDPVWPDKQWAVSTPEEEGIDPVAIKAIHTDINAGKYGLVDGFVLIRHGRMVADYRYAHNYDSIAAAYDTTNHMFNYDHPAWHPYYQRSNLHTLQSVTKSVTSIALGIAIDAGHIPGVDVQPMEFFHSYDPDFSDQRRTDMTLEDMLTMRSGIDWNEMTSYELDENSCIIMEKSNDWIQYVVNRPMREQPGTRWDYNSGVSVLLGKLVGISTGQRVDQWTEERLFKPLGITNYFWKTTPNEEVDTEGGLYLSAHDMARLGYLFLRQGNWNGKQVVSKAWVEQSIKPTVKDIAPDNSTNNSGYGYQWWVPSTDPHIFSAVGYGGQLILVAPAYDLVAVFTGWNIHYDNTSLSAREALAKRIIPATTPDPAP
ncbi:MAG: serine hydrolase [Cytophagales bacterium]|nr:serine hydrolase [Cytophagales bacterium]